MPGDRHDKETMSIGRPLFSLETGAQVCVCRGPTGGAKPLGVSVVQPPPPPHPVSVWTRHGAVKQGKSAGSVGTSFGGKGKGREVERNR